jgi:Leucine-rich repeat (LRR) protein
MFIKKDLRKIAKILEDAVECVPTDNKDNKDNDDDVDDPSRSKRPKIERPLQELRLGRRQQEFQGTVQILCQPKYLPKLQDLQSLNLYDCGIANLDSISVLGDCPNFEILNLGRNPLTTLPDELCKVTSLQQIWLDDCQLAGALSQCLLNLPNLSLLRAPHNHITEIPASIAQCTQLKILCLDRNELTSLPEDLPPQLEELLVRHNQLTELPKSLPPSLRILHISSNQLTELNSVADNCKELTHVYANGNQLTTLPEGLFEAPLQRLVVSHNPIASVPPVFWTQTECEIVWKPNPHLEPSSEEEDAAMPPATE